MNSHPKRLIEVDLPIKRISAHARREKSIRHGHISTLHIWWARRPLAAARAVIFAQMVDDPSAQPEAYPTAEAQEATIGVTVKAVNHRYLDVQLRVPSTLAALESQVAEPDLPMTVGKMFRDRAWRVSSRTAIASEYGSCPVAHPADQILTMR